jgi:hypothetical protein
MAQLRGLLLLALVFGCGDVDTPNLCVFSAADATDPRSLDAKGCVSQSFTAGEAVYVVHQLPTSANVKEQVSITVATACDGSATTTMHSFDHNKAIFSTVAPPGAECALEVTASVLNETTRYVSTHPEGPCTPRCPASPGTGGEASAP